MRELSSKQIFDIFLDPKTYYMDKLDGSYLRAGIDDEGRFYTSRQGNVRYYSISDWPELAWTNSFRAAHGLLEIALGEIVRVKQEYIDNNRAFYDNDIRRHYTNTNENTGRNIYLDVEIINGILPNTVLYDRINEYQENSVPWTNTDITLFMTGYRFFNATDYEPAFSTSNTIEVVEDRIKKSSSHLETAILDPLVSLGVYCDQIVTEDGKTLETKKIMFRGILRNSPKKNSTRLTVTTGLDIPWIVKFNLSESPVILLRLPQGNLRFTHIPLKELWDLKFVSCPDFLTPETWKLHKPELIRQLREIKAKLQKDFEEKIYGHLHHHVCQLTHHSDLNEGIVVINDAMGIKFKLINAAFKRCNKLTHIVRYWLQDGRRPSRPCFISRTAGWSNEAKLKRLDVLLKRYLKHRKDMFDFKYTEIGYQIPQLNQRTLVLFAEIRRDIQNGRYSVSRESTQDPA